MLPAPPVRTTLNFAPAQPSPADPPGMIGREAAARMFGISIGQWMAWQRCGRVRCGTWAPRTGGKPGRRRLFPIDELRRLQEELRQRAEPYPDPERPGCCRVPLRSNLRHREALIDEESLPLVAGRHWNWAPHADDREGRVILSAASTTAILLCRLIVGATGFGTRVSHLNGDPLDCRRANLAVRSCAEQLYASAKIETRAGQPVTSRFKGVSWDKGRGKWRAQIKTERRQRAIGRFDEEIDAARAYDREAIKFFGEHARLNFPQEAGRAQTPAETPALAA